MATKEMICLTCGYVGKPITKTKGGCLIELTLWLFMILPGILYSLWRLTSKEKVCPSCEKATMIPTTTPKGKELLKKAKNQRKN